MGTEGEWFTGPLHARRTYRVRDTTSLPGGRGFVFPAERVEDGLAVALKIIEENDPRTAVRIETCYAALRRHPHPGLIEPVSLFLGPGLFSGDSDDPPDSDSDLLYLAYRWVKGRTLRAAAPLDPAGAARLATDLASAVSHLHRECWLIHRDIHPGNIIIDDSGRAVLIDIDAWVEVGDSGAAPASGVLGFLPPERSQGRWDERSDGWALGMVVAYSLLGHPLGAASNRELAAQLAHVLPRRVNAQRVADLLGQMTHNDPERRPGNLVGWAAELSEALTARNRRSFGSRVALGLGTALAVTALGGMALGWRLADDNSVSPNNGESASNGASAEMVHPNRMADDPCPIALGEPAPDMMVGDLDVISRWADDLAAAAPGACALDYAEVYRQALHQPVEIDGEAQVVVASEAATLLMHPVQFDSYQQITERGSDVTVELGGYPVEVLDPLPGVESLIRLSKGGLIVGRRVDTQAFWMPESVLRLWESHGGFEGELGLPMTNPYSEDEELKQDFEYGQVLIPVSTPLTWDVFEVDELEVALADSPSPLPPGPGILRQPNRTAWWYVDGQRHWIPDGGVWNCLGGHDQVVFNNIDGVTLATVPLGPPATCAMAD